MATRYPKLTYEDGYKAGQYDAENGQPLAYIFDQGDFQNAEWHAGYNTGKISLAFDRG